MLERFANLVAKATGTTYAFICACALILIWLVCGPIFDFSDTWQLIINTSTTIITFLMVFLVQRSQNRDVAALHIKLNELIRAVSSANNRMINIEEKSEAQLKKLHDSYDSLRKPNKV